MSVPLVVNRVVGRAGRAAALRTGLAVLGGVLLCGACLGASLTQDLDEVDQFQAAALAAVGAVFACWGLARLPVARRLLFRGPVLRLDEHGVWVRTGSIEDRTAASVPWPAVAAVEVAPVRLPPQFQAGGSPVREVVRFVPRDEAAVEHDPLPAYAIIKATALGLSPVAGALTFIVGAETADRVPRVLAWLAAERPDLPVRDLRA